MDQKENLSHILRGKASTEYLALIVTSHPSHVKVLGNGQPLPSRKMDWESCGQIYFSYRPKYPASFPRMPELRCK